jgi:hypothetical protein
MHLSIPSTQPQKGGQSIRPAPVLHSTHVRPAAVPNPKNSNKVPKRNAEGRRNHGKANGARKKSRNRRGLPNRCICVEFLRSVPTPRLVESGDGRAWVKSPPATSTSHPIFHAANPRGRRRRLGYHPDRSTRSATAPRPTLRPRALLLHHGHRPPILPRSCPRVANRLALSRPLSRFRPGSSARARQGRLPRFLSPSARSRPSPPPSHPPAALYMRCAAPTDIKPANAKPSRGKAEGTVLHDSTTTTGFPETPLQLQWRCPLPPRRPRPTTTCPWGRRC